jgi:hypothetical protein
LAERIYCAPGRGRLVGLERRGRDDVGPAFEPYFHLPILLAAPRLSRLQGFDLLAQLDYFPLGFFARGEALLPTGNLLAQPVILIAQVLTNALGGAQPFMSFLQRLELAFSLR